ncbi:MAG: 5-formyltetrahydrofolate cyclo-ligase [Zoogloeaceae bacterium]|jgi:5,10-methenyltetrahydrofolate synthetase|nr:5-formyltetrahydrofolate cyclo-ligase [Zoogloeaceae bacterium]
MKDEKGRKPDEMPQDSRQSLRATRLAARRACAPEQAAAWSRQIVAHLLRVFPRPPGKRIAFCWPIHNEPDVRAAVGVWREAGATIALPVTIAPQTPLVFRAWTLQTPLAADAFGIPAPLSGELLQPDVFVIPLNVFDAAGYRLGYGGGFFDRTLAALQYTPLTLGVGFELGRVARIPPQTHDYPLDWLFTEAGSWAAQARHPSQNEQPPAAGSQPPESRRRRR